MTVEERQKWLAEIEKLEKEAERRKKHQKRTEIIIEILIYEVWVLSTVTIVATLWRLFS